MRTDTVKEKVRENCSKLCNSPKLETTTMLYNVLRVIVWYTYNIEYGSKTKQLKKNIDTNKNLRRSQMYYDVKKSKFQLIFQTQHSTDTKIKQQKAAEEYSL